MIDFNQPQPVKPITASIESSAQEQQRDLRGLPLAGLLRAINHVLRQQDWARERLAAHQGKSIRLGIEASFPLALFAPNLMTRVDANGFLQEADPLKSRQSGHAPSDTVGVSTNADVCLWLRPSLDALFAGFRAGPAGLSSHLRVEGDVLLAGVIGELAQHLRWDFEEDLSQVVGDVAARRAVSSTQNLGLRIKDSQNRVESAAVQWLTIEQAYLVDRSSFAAFSAELLELSQSVDRLSARF